MRSNEKEYRDYMLSKSKGIRDMKDGTGNDGYNSNERYAAGGGAEPAQEATSDPAPTRHAPLNAGQRALEKSKYEASEVFKAKKGDRFTTSIWGSNK
jgi:hypothetical protein